MALAALILASGCADGDGTGANDAPASPLEANARAAATNVGLTDLAPGYAAILRSEEDDDGAPTRQCVDTGVETAIAEVVSPTFALQADSRVTFVESETTVLSDPAQAKLHLSSVREQPVISCLSGRLDEEFAGLLPSATSDTPLALALDPTFLPNLGDDSFALSGEALLILEDGTRASISTALIFVQTGDTVTSLVVGGLYEPFPPETARSLAATIAERQG
jgi:hypothetical protein